MLGAEARLDLLLAVTLRVLPIENHLAILPYAESIPLDEYALKMFLDIQIGSLGAEKFNLEIHKNPH